MFRSQPGGQDPCHRLRHETNTVNGRPGRSMTQGRKQTGSAGAAGPTEVPGRPLLKGLAKGGTLGIAAGGAVVLIVALALDQGAPVLDPTPPRDISSIGWSGVTEGGQGNTWTPTTGLAPVNDPEQIRNPFRPDPVTPAPRDLPALGPVPREAPAGLAEIRAPRHLAPFSDSNAPTSVAATAGPRRSEMLARSLATPIAPETPANKAPPPVQLVSPAFAGWEKGNFRPPVDAATDASVPSDADGVPRTADLALSVPADPAVPEIPPEGRASTDDAARAVLLIDGTPSDMPGWAAGRIGSDLNSRREVAILNGEGTQQSLETLRQAIASGAAPSAVLVEARLSDQVERDLFPLLNTSGVGLLLAPGDFGALAARARAAGVGVAQVYQRIANGDGPDLAVQIERLARRAERDGTVVALIDAGALAQTGELLGAGTGAIAPAPLSQAFVTR